MGHRESRTASADGKARPHSAQSTERCSLVCVRREDQVGKVAPQPDSMHVYILWCVSSWTRSRLGWRNARVQPSVEH